MDEAQDALKTLLHPFTSFPFVDDVSRGVFIAALITAAIRTTLPTAPIFALTAHMPGSGKTLLGQCMQALTGDSSGIMTVALNHEEELEKTGFAALRRGAKTLLFDNAVGLVRSEYLMKITTAESLTQRILGVSEEVTIDTRALILLTGNNIQPVGDLNRRMLMCLIDPAMEKPWTREFDLDPLDYTRRNRQEMVAAALTLLRAYKAMHDGERLGKGRTASFEQWDDFVRQCVCWISTWSRDEWPVADPIDSIDQTISLDPEQAKLASLLSSIHDLIGSEFFTVKSLMEKVASSWDRDKKVDALESALDEVANDGRHINARMLGRWIEKHSGQMVEGFHLISQGVDRKTKTKRWQVRGFAGVLGVNSNPELKVSEGDKDNVRHFISGGANNSGNTHKHPRLPDGVDCDDCANRSPCSSAYSNPIRCNAGYEFEDDW